MEQAAARLVPREPARLGLEFGHATPRLCQYLDLLLDWNRRVDLTAARTADELVDLVVGDALVLARHCPAGVSRWVDVGAGAGAPALPLALLCPELELTLVEPKAKRVAFLRTAVGALGLQNASVLRARSESLADASFDTALSRATLPPDAWLEEGARLATRSVWVLLARGDAPEWPGWRLELTRVYRWPLTGARRRAVRYACEAGE